MTCRYEATSTDSLRLRVYVATLLRQLRLICQAPWLLRPREPESRILRIR